MGTFVGSDLRTCANYSAIPIVSCIDADMFSFISSNAYLRHVLNDFTN